MPQYSLSLLGPDLAEIQECVTSQSFSPVVGETGSAAVPVTGGIGAADRSLAQLVSGGRQPNR